MARKRKKAKNENQSYLIFPDYMEVTPEDEKLIKEIKNPFVFSYSLAGLSFVLGLILLAITLLTNSDLNLIKFYYIIFTIACFVYSLTQFYFTYKKNKAYNSFIKLKEYRIIWTYSDEKYDDFYNGIEEHNKTNSKSGLLITVGIMILLMVLLYFTMDPLSRFIAIPFGLICIGVVVITGFVIPYTYLYDARKKPYITLINDDAAYALGRFYRWEKAHVKFKVLNKSYGIDATEMRITYQEPSIFGKKTPTFQVLIPNNERFTLNYARRVGKRINKTRELLNESPESHDDFMDKAFKKMLGSNEE